MASPPSSPVGAHVPVSGGLARRGLPYADAIGAEVVQVFVTNPRGWACPPGDPEQDALLRRYAEWFDALDVAIEGDWVRIDGIRR